VVAALRQRVAGPATDRFLAPEIEVAVEMTSDGSFVAAAQTAAGALV
jgi:histidine ammonia-lyase